MSTEMTALNNLSANPNLKINTDDVIDNIVEVEYAEVLNNSTDRKKTKQELIGLIKNSPRYIEIQTSINQITGSSATLQKMTDSFKVMVTNTVAILPSASVNPGAVPTVNANKENLKMMLQTMVSISTVILTNALLIKYNVPNSVIILINGLKGLEILIDNI